MSQKTNIQKIFKDKDALREVQVVNHICSFLEDKGWILKELPAEVGGHGADIRAWHPKWRKSFIIEVKGEGNTHRTQAMHNAFWTVLGQILTRMDRPGNHPNRSRYYAIGFPKFWETTFKNKIMNMKHGWKLLKLKVFLVSEDGIVEEKPYSYFLR